MYSTRASPLRNHYSIHEFMLQRTTKTQTRSEELQNASQNSFGDEVVDQFSTQQRSTPFTHKIHAAV